MRSEEGRRFGWLTHERRVFILSLLAGLPAVVLSLVLLELGNYSTKVTWTLGTFVVGHSEDSLKKLRQRVVEQLCAATGGPCVYTGRDMKTAHKGMGISESDWNAAVVHLVATLDKFKVPAAEKNELLTAVSALKTDIVEKK